MITAGDDRSLPVRRQAFLRVDRDRQRRYRVPDLGECSQFGRSLCRRRVTQDAQHTPQLQDIAKRQPVFAKLERHISLGAPVVPHHASNRELIESRRRTTANLQCLDVLRCRRNQRLGAVRLPMARAHRGAGALRLDRESDNGPGSLIPHGDFVEREVVAGELRADIDERGDRRRRGIDEHGRRVVVDRQNDRVDTEAAEI